MDSRPVIGDIMSLVNLWVLMDAGVVRLACLLWLLDLMEGRKEMFYLTTHSTHFIYGCMASDIW